MPMAVQPPRIYPVAGRSSFMAIISAFLLPEILAAFLRSTSRLPAITHTKRPVRSPRSTSVLNTRSTGSPRLSATWSAARLSGSTSYGTSRYVTPSRSRILAALVFFSFGMGISVYMGFARFKIEVCGQMLRESLDLNPDTPDITKVIKSSRNNK